MWGPQGLPAKHADSHLPGGDDPLALPGPVLYAGRGTGGDTTVTTPWELEVIPTMSAFLQTNDQNGEVFEEVQDSNGVNGIRVLQEGLYLFTGLLGVSFNGIVGSTRMMPKYLRLEFGYRGSGSSPFGWSTGFAGNSAVWSDNAYLPDDTDLAELSVTNGFTLYATYLFPLLDLNSGPANVPIDYFLRLQSWGGVEDWKYSAAFTIWRLSDALPMVFL